MTKLNILFDNSIRIFKSNSKKCHAILKGHEDNVSGVHFLPDGRLLSFSDGEEIFKVWDISSRSCTTSVNFDDLDKSEFYPWDSLMDEVLIDGRHIAWSKENSVVLASIPQESVPDGFWDKDVCRYIARWESDCDVTAHYLHVDGTIAATLSNGEVAYLRLFHGKQKLRLSDLAS